MILHLMKIEIYRLSLNSNFTEEKFWKPFFSFAEYFINRRITSNYYFLKKLKICINLSPLIIEFELYLNFNAIDNLIDNNIVILNASSERERMPEPDVSSEHSDRICGCPQPLQYNYVSPRRPRPRNFPQPWCYEEIECEYETPRVCEPCPPCPRICEPNPCPPCPEPCPPDPCPPEEPCSPRVSSPTSPKRSERRERRTQNVQDVVKWALIVLGYVLLLLALFVVMYSYFKVTIPPEKRAFTNFLHFWDIT